MMHRSASNLSTCLLALLFLLVVLLNLLHSSSAGPVAQQAWEYQPLPSWYQASKQAPIVAYPPSTYEHRKHSFSPQMYHHRQQQAQHQQPIIYQPEPLLGGNGRITDFEQTPTSPAPQSSDLLAAIKDVVNKFRNHIDQSGIQEDVWQMSAHLQNTWDQIKRGLHRSWDALKNSAQVSVGPYSGHMSTQLEKLLQRAQQMVADATMHQQHQQRVN